MRPEDLQRLLEGVRAGDRSVEEALAALKRLPFADLGFARVDHHRQLRTGAPEVIFGQGKSAEQIVAIAEELVRAGSDVLVTRLEPAVAATVVAALPGARSEPLARAVVWSQQPWRDVGRGVVLVVSAGTSDLPVAEEAALTAHLLGSRVERIHDVGVAGLHRLLAVQERLEAAEVIVAVAGMEGALPSVVKGLCSRPVIAVPTSVGYGVSLGGLTALMAMLVSCASGITVVNIDNGFGAGFAAATMNRRRATETRES